MAPSAPAVPHSLCPLPPSRDTTSSCARGDLVRVTYYDTYGYRSRTGILDEVLPAFKLLKLKDIAIDFDDIQDIELRGRA